MPRPDPVPARPAPTPDRAHDRHVPVLSVIFGYGPMLPLLAGGVAAWAAPWPWSLYAVQATILWGAVILVFVAGVRRGFGFGEDGASTAVELATMMVYFLLGLAALVALALSPRFALALGLLILGYLLVALLDTRAARRGDEPAHFARLRPTQMPLGALGLAIALIRVAS